MAYRSLYRVLGETSLELKCLALFGAFLLLVITVSFLSYWYVTEQVVTNQNTLHAGRLALETIVFVHWTGLVQNEPGYRERVRLLHEDLTRQFSSDSEEDLGKFIPCDPTVAPSGRVRQPDRDDTFERDCLERYKSHRWVGQTPTGNVMAEKPPEFSYRYRKGPAGGSEYQYYKPVYVEPTCIVICHHGSPGLPSYEPDGPPLGLGGPQGSPWSAGDFMGMICVTISNKKGHGKTVHADISWYWNMLLGVAILTAFLAMIAFYVTIRYLIVRPLRHLREVSDSISRGNIARRADIRTGDEFESLAVAFNRMLRHLVTVQDELRQVNTDLDGKVDELAQVNMQLYEMNRIKSDFLATMSHELRTPLNSILGFSDVLGSIDSLDDKQKRYVQNIQKSGRMLLEMINNILDLAKIESGKVEVRLSEFQIEQVIAAQCDMARPLSEKKNIDLTTEIQPDLPPMFQDQSRVQQILNNLLSNAIKFTPEGGRIRVAASCNGRDELLLRVVDTGVGIAEEDRQIIFEKFRQGKTALPGGDAITREYSGTGLGLSIVKELCRLLDGEVTVESEVGLGSTFTVRLPWKLQKQPRLEH